MTPAYIRGIQCNLDEPVLGSDVVGWFSYRRCDRRSCVCSFCRFVHSIVCSFMGFSLGFGHYLGPVICDDVFMRLQRRLFSFGCRFCPEKRGHRARYSCNESSFSRRGTQSSFPLLEGGVCKTSGYWIAHCSTLLPKTLSNWSPPFVQLPLLRRET